MTKDIKRGIESATLFGKQVIPGLMDVAELQKTMNMIDHLRNEMYEQFKLGVSNRLESPRPGRKT